MTICLIPWRASAARWDCLLFEVCDLLDGVGVRSSSATEVMTWNEEALLDNVGPKYFVSIYPVWFKRDTFIRDSQ